MKKFMTSFILSAAVAYSGFSFAETATDSSQQKATTAREKMMKSGQKSASMTEKKTKRGMIGQYKGVGSRSVARFNKIDSDNNGTISQTEFTNSHTTAFNKKDKNKDGQLSPVEFSPTLAKKSAAKM